LRPKVDRHRRRDAAVDVAGQDFGLVDGAQHRVVPARRAAALHELAADDRAVGSEPHLDRCEWVAGDVAGEHDVRLDARLDAAGVARRRARGTRRRSGGRRVVARAGLAHHPAQVGLADRRLPRFVLPRLLGELLLLRLLVGQALPLAIGFLATRLLALRNLGLARGFDSINLLTARLLDGDLRIGAWRDARLGPRWGRR